MIDNIQKLLNMLKKRNNKSYLFFENILIDLSSISKKKDALFRLSRSYSMTQYSDFKNEEEELLSKIIENAINEIEKKD